MPTQSQQERADEMDSAATLVDQIIAKIIAVIKNHMSDDLPQIQFDPWAGDHRGRSLRFDPWAITLRARRSIAAGGEPTRQAGSTIRSDSPFCPQPLLASAAGNH